MIDWRKFLQDGHQFDFYSPNSLQACGEMLRDQSRRPYFQSTPFDWLIYRKKSNVLFVDVHPQSQNVYTFRIERDLGMGRSAIPMTITGKLERVGTTTHVVGQVSKQNSEWLFWMLIIILVTIGWISLFIQYVFSGNWRMAIPMLGIYPLGLALQWLIFIRPFWNFIHCVENWLGAESNQIVYEESAWMIPFWRSFDFYTDDSREKCVDALSYPSHQGRYQYTTQGMMKGLPLDGGLFIATTEYDSEHTHFLIEQDAISNRYGVRAQLIGQIQAEGEVTRVHGYVYLPHGWVYIGLYGAVVWGAMTFFIVSSILVMIIPIILGIAGYLNIQSAIKQVYQYPHEKILGDTTQSKSGTFDFHSPYPPEDAVNMLFDYTEPQDYETPWGIGKGVRANDEILVVVVEENGTYRLMVGFEGAKILSFYAYLQVHATLRPEGYGTRVVGGLNHEAGNGILLTGTIGTILSIFVLILSANIALLPIAIIALPIGTIGFYATVKQNAQMLVNYPRHALSGKANRKQKVADEQ